LRSAELDGEVRVFLAERGRRVAEEFATTVGELPLLEWGDYPVFQSAGSDGRPRIFVAREGADWWRIRYQIAHEVFHWVCSPPGTYHWTHEFFAVETAVRAMAAIGELDYARRTMAGLREEADLMALGAMLVSPLPGVYGPGLYGRAWVTGRELTSAVGWVRMKLLAGCFDADGKPDVVGWMRSFPQEERAKLEAILGVPSPAWV
jgi:hypothetical protein